MYHSLMHQSLLSIKMANGHWLFNGFAMAYDPGYNYDQERSKNYKQTHRQRQ